MRKESKMGKDATTQAGPDIKDWRHEVLTGDTILGFEDWRAAKIEAAERPGVIEFTIGVCVRMKWDGAAYVFDGSPCTTDGGLFTDATEGPFDPDAGEWIGLDNGELLYASDRAHRLVHDALSTR
jgi:hypothetical protein